MLSIPPATMVSASSSATACAASMTDFKPDPHTLFTVKHSTDFGKPAKTAACRAGACPTPAGRTLPMITSFTSESTTPALLIASRTTSAPSLGAESDESVPRNDPMGVRQALAMTTSFISVSTGLLVKQGTLRRYSTRLRRKRQENPVRNNHASRLRRHGKLTGTGSAVHQLEEFFVALGATHLLHQEFHRFDRIEL